MIKQKQSIYECITDIIVKKLEEGVVPWKKLWKSKYTNDLHINYLHILQDNKKNYYRGINQILLDIDCETNDYEFPYWLTFKQCNSIGGSIKKGAKSTFVVFWKKIKVKKNDEMETIIENDIKEDYWVLRYFNVFNIEQCENIPQPEKIKKHSSFNPIVKCEEIVSNMPNKPRIKHGGNRAVYNSDKDYIKLPVPDNFITREYYYNVLFHELIHSTGHKDRLNRKAEYSKKSKFGNKTYAKEELVAELGSSMLCAVAGIEKQILDNSSAYIEGWLQALKNDKRMIVFASSLAQKACDFILGDGK